MCSLFVSHAGGSSPSYLCFCICSKPPSLVCLPVLPPSLTLTLVCLCFFFLLPPPFISLHVCPPAFFRPLPSTHPLHLCSGTGRDGPIALLVRVGCCLPCGARLKFTDWDGFLLRPGVDSWDKAESKEVELAGRVLEEKSCESVCVLAHMHSAFFWREGAAPTLHVEDCSSSMSVKKTMPTNLSRQSTLA